jgi:carotenoid cleavage dioxygenase
VIRRDGAAVRWFDVDPCFVFHPLNANEGDGPVTVDLVWYPEMFRRSGPSRGEHTRQMLVRWELDLASGSLRQEVVDDRPQEFPRVDPRVVGHQHTIGYASAGLLEPPFPSHGIHRVDLTAGSRTTWHAGPGRVPGEPSFVPAGGGESDGYLVSFVYDAATDRSDLVVLDASRMVEVASVHLPVRVPFGFHGSWVPDDPSTITRQA